MGDEGGFTVSQPIKVAEHIVVTTNPSLQAELAATGPRREGKKTPLNREGLEAVREEYERVTGANFELQLNIVQRNPKSHLERFPLPWAISYLLTCLERRILNQDDFETRHALYIIATFNNTVSTWGHHPRFGAVASGLGKPESFIHTAYLFLTASYLYGAGNRVGFSLEDKVGEPNPDLYSRLDAHYIAHLEAKAPKAFQFSGFNEHTPIDAGAVIQRTLKKSSSQINRNHRGYLIIASSLLRSGLAKEIHAAVPSVLRAKGRDHRGLASVLVACPAFARFSDGSYDAAISYEVFDNPHFDGFE